MDRMKSVATVVAMLLALLGPCSAIPQQPMLKNPDNLDEKINKVFGSAATGGLMSNRAVIIDEKPQPNTQTDGNRNPCECVPYYQCQNNTITTDGTGILDIRSGFHTTCSDYLDVCCEPPNVLPPESKVIPMPPLTLRRGCGLSNPYGAGLRIVGSANEAQFGEFPWMVAILQEELVGPNGEILNVYKCGGALVHPSVVLTAAHCINGMNPSRLKARAGEWDTQTRKEILPHQDRMVRTYVVHEDFRSGSLHNDFALLMLDKPVDIAGNVDVVCLPEAHQNFDTEDCIASGWGKDVFGKKGHYQVILKRIDLRVVPHDRCQNSLRNTRLGKYFQLHQSFICAGGAGKDTCKGDGGSPLVCPIKSSPGRFYQAGIVAWGIGCGENGVPGVYANVAAARSWIDWKFNQWNLNSNSYNVF